MTPSNQNSDMQTLDDRYLIENGRVYLNGTQALLRLMVDRNRRDKANGLNTASYITGYPGSPLGGITNVLEQTKTLLAKFNVRHQQAQNEEIGAAVLMGTQMVDEHPEPNVDGVIGFWYGKGPGVDRSTDALRHGNSAGTSRNGAVVILSGEDHEAKSSSLPYGQEFAFEHMGIPVLYPATVAEFIEFGQHAIEMSRFVGIWVALKLVGTLCDGGDTIDVDPMKPNIVLPDVIVDGKPFAKRTNFLFTTQGTPTERHLYHDRHIAVRAYARTNHLDRIVVRGPNDRIGIAAAGKSFTDIRNALRDLGFDDAALNAHGIRLLKVGLLCPMDTEIIREFAQGLDKIIVVEEKRDFLERQIGRAVCDLTHPVKIVGKYDEAGEILFPVEGGIEPDQITEILARELRRSHAVPDRGQNRIAALQAQAMKPNQVLAQRMPHFCSGCPHSIGTRVLPGQPAWAAPGCHIFAAFAPDPNRRVTSTVHYGGDGLPWLGLAPYTGRKHMLINVGDGSFFHSSYLNVRYALENNVNMTFRILYNGAIANTGGQLPIGIKPVADVARLFAIEGVKKTIIVTKEPQRYANERLPDNTQVRDAVEMEDVLAELSEVPGVTTIIHDSACANERRRQQKRGKLPKPVKFTIVNEDVCENCGDCGKVSNCMSVQKIATPYGNKTRIHQPSCNQDMSCQRGECPSFITVETQPGGGVKRPKMPIIANECPEPTLPALKGGYRVYMPGLGGTGVITVNAILAQAAALDGTRVLSYDQTGAAQKWGAVISTLILTHESDPYHNNKVGIGLADVYIALDLLAGNDHTNLKVCDSERTVAVINSTVYPTPDTIRNVHLMLPVDAMIDKIAARTKHDKLVKVEAREISEALFGDFMMTNMIAIGTTYQAGLLPISAASIEAAITLNNVQIETNIAAFRAGRLAYHAPEQLDALMPHASKLFADRDVVNERELSASQRAARDTLVASIADLNDENRALFAKRIADLILYQNEGYARQYAGRIADYAARTQAALNGQHQDVMRAVITNLHKLMACKDEYEVARLLTQSGFEQRVMNAFRDPVRISFMLQPPLMRLFGLKKKVALGPWFKPFLSLLASFKSIRGTWLDPFGYAMMRRQERELPQWYTRLLDEALAHTAQSNVGQLDAALMHDIAMLPDLIRGYEHVKQQSLAETQQKADALLKRLKTQPASSAAA